MSAVVRFWRGVHDLRNNPFFRREVQRRERRRWTLFLVLTSSLYVAVFAAVCLTRALSAPAAVLSVSAPFNCRPWLWLGGGLLSLCAHWLIPFLLVTLLCGNYELWALSLLVRERRSEEEALQGQVAAGVAPALTGIVPLLVGLPLLLVYARGYALPAAAAVGAALLWGSLSTCVSSWAAVYTASPRAAVLRAHALLSLALPLLIGGITVGIAYGCSAGHPHRAAVFTIAAAMTWTILVTGAAAAFWDLTFGRVFPHKRRVLWVESAHLTTDN